MVTAQAFSLNNSALNLANNLIDDQDRYRVSAYTSQEGATLIDAGLYEEGGLLAGQVVTEICLAGLGKASEIPLVYGENTLPSVFVTTDAPALSLLGSQFAGWRIEMGDFSANASGPCRALVSEPHELFQLLKYKEESDVAVIVLETDLKPQDALVSWMAERCRASTKNLYIVFFSAKSLTGVFQACARVVEAGLSRLVEVGLDPLLVKHAWGFAPIASVSQSSSGASERTRAAIRYCGVANYAVEVEDEKALQSMVNQTNASALHMIRDSKQLSNQYRRYRNIYALTKIENTKVNLEAISPAIVKIDSTLTGKSYSAGEFNLDNISIL